MIKNKSSNLAKDHMAKTLNWTQLREAAVTGDTGVKAAPSLQGYTGSDLQCIDPGLLQQQA